MDDNFQQILLKEFKKVLGPLVDSGKGDDIRNDLLDNIGWVLDNVDGLSIADVDLILQNATVLVNDIQDLIDNPPETLEDFTTLLNTIQSLMDLVVDIKNLAVLGTTPVDFEQISKDVLNYLFISYLDTYKPLLYRILVLLTVIKDGEQNDEQIHLRNGGGNVIRQGLKQSRIDFSVIGELVKDAKSVLISEYLPNGALLDSNDVKYTSDKLFPRVRDILTFLNIHSTYGLSSVYGQNYGAVGNELGNHMLSSVFYLPGTGIHMGGTIALSAPDTGDLGVIISPFGTISLNESRNGWEIDAQISSAISGFAIGPQGLTIPSMFSDISVLMEILIKRATEEGVAFNIGSTQGTRLSIGGFEVQSTLNFSDNLSEYSVEFRILNSSLIIKPENGDNFLKHVLPTDGLNIDFELIFGFGNYTGFYFRGSGGLELDIPIHKTILNVLEIHSVFLGVKANSGGLSLFTTLNSGLNIGPFVASISEVGVQAGLEFVPEGGNLGVLDASLGFKPPSGVGFTIDASAIKGGGFLSFGFEEERYIGALELSIKDKIALKVIGILTTKLPGNDDGYSLLLLITAEFEPLNLGFGFTLNGVGGLIALNRTMNLNYLRDGVKSNTLDNILFPTDPIQNINQIISDLEGAFPVEEGRYSFGPMAIIGWGTPTLITVELGLMLELPSPVRLAVLGVLKAILPTEEKSLLKLQVNFLGTIDFEAKYITFDASIFASKLLSFTLEGDMAFRLKWGDNPNFLFSIGGFHPSYTPPPLDLPALNRLTINLLGGDNPRLTLTSYFAITSNTVQFGSAVDFYYKITNKYRVIGYLGFDILIQFNPFYLIASIAAQLSVMKNSEAVLSIYLGATVSGPAPWNVKGKAEFKVFGIKLKVDFDKTFGQPETTTLPNVDVLPRLIEAVENKANWQAINSDRSNLLVTLRELNNAPGDVVAHPFGSIGVSQKIVPLDMTINKFGTQRPADYQKFSLDIADGSGTNFEEENVQDFFAPAEYLEMSDSSKLTRKSFEEFNSGVAIKGSDELRSSYLLERELAYEQVIMDSRHIPDRVGLIQENSLRFNAFRRNGTAAKSRLGTKSKPKSENAPAKVSVQQEKYAIAHIDDMSQYGGLEAGSEAEARVLLEGLLESDPALTDSIQVVPFYEVA